MFIAKFIKINNRTNNWKLILIVCALSTLTIFTSCSYEEILNNSLLNSKIEYGERIFIHIENISESTFFIPKRLNVENLSITLIKDTIHYPDTLILGQFTKDPMLTPNFYNLGEMIKIKPNSKAKIFINFTKNEIMKTRHVQLRLYRKNVSKIYHKNNRNQDFFELESKNSLLYWVQ
ncbi:MAG: hypothetical protein ACE364_10395 [Chlorobiota bacterium]